MRSEDNLNKYISLQEATRLCNYSQEYLSLRARQGKLKAVKFGRNWVTKQGWMEEYLGQVDEYNNVHENSGIKKLGVVPDNLPIELAAWQRIKMPSLPRMQVTGLRIGFLAALTFSLLLHNIVFGKESFRNVFNGADNYVAMLSVGSDRLLADSQKSFENIFPTIDSLTARFGREADRSLAESDQALQNVFGEASLYAYLLGSGADGFLADSGESLKNVFKDSSVFVGNFADSFDKGLASGIRVFANKSDNYLGELSDFTNKFLVNSGGGVKNIFGTLSSFAGKSGGRMEGLFDKFDKNLKNIRSGLASAVLGFGDNFDRGLLSGIRSLTNVVSSHTGESRNLPGEFLADSGESLKNVFKDGSVFVDGFGDNFDRGLASGIGNWRPGASSLVEGIDFYAYILGSKTEEFLINSDRSFANVYGDLKKIDLGLADAGKAIDGNFKNYFSWLEQRAIGAGERIVEGYKNANSMLEENLEKLAFEIKDGYLAAKSFGERKIFQVWGLAQKSASDVIGFVSSTGRSWRSKISGLGEFAVSPWKRVFPGKISEVGEFATKEEYEALEKEVGEMKENGLVVKEITREVTRITQVEPVKEITKEIVKLDEKALGQVRAQIVDLQDAVSKRLYAPGGVVSQQIYITQPVSSPKVYQENGDIVYQTVGTGNVILSAATGMQISGKQVVIDSTAASNPLVYIADRTEIGGDTSVGGTLTSQKVVITGGDGNILDVKYDGSSKFSVDNAGASLVGNFTLTGNLTASGTTTLAGYVGIGTTTPAYALSINGTTTIENGSLKIGNYTLPTATSTTGYVMKLNADGTVTFQAEAGGSSYDPQWITNSTTLYASSTFLKVGIGTTTPTEVLTIKATSTSPGLGVYASNSTPIIYTSLAGYVGMGTSTPSELLHLYATGGGPNLMIESSLATGYPRIEFKHPNTSWTAQTDGATNDFLLYNKTGGTNYYSFTIEDTAPTDTFRITASGRVGISTTTPSELLTVWGGMSVATSSSFQTFYVASTTGRVGVGTSSPATLFTVATSTNIFNVSLTGLSGFGTSSPSEILTVKASGAAAGLGVYASNSTPIIYTSLAGYVGIGTTSPATLFSIATSSDIFNVTTGGNIGIGTASPIAQLHVPATVPISLASTSAGTSTYSVYAQGRYVYAINYDSRTFQVLDVSNPSSPVTLGTTTTGANPYGLYVQGRYAYVVSSGSNGIFQIIDISDPVLLRNVGTTTAGVGLYSVYVQGRYAYTSTAGNKLQIFDVSDPSSPTTTASASTGSLPNSVYVQGRYAYVVNYTSNTFQVFDVSNPASIGSPVTLSLGAGMNPYSVYVQGRYAYVVDAGTSLLHSIDVSNPSSPSIVATTTTGSTPTSVYVQGRYAYVTNQSGKTLQVFDVSNPSSLTSVATAGTDKEPTTVYVQGRYAYVANKNSLQVFDVGGSYIQQFEAGTIEAAGLSLRNNLQVNNNADIKGGLNIGGGFNAIGSGGIYASSGASAFAVTQTGSGYGAIIMGGNVGIGTTTATEVLTIKATSTSPGLGVYASNSTPIIYTSLAGNVGIGTSSPAYTLSINGTTTIENGSLKIGNYTLPTATSTTGHVMKLNADGTVTFQAEAGGSSYDPQWITSGTTLYASSTFLNVGIGTTTPATLFSVATSSDIFNVTTGGNVGIGTTTPSALLHIDGRGGPTYGIKINNLGGNNMGIDMSGSGLSGSSDYFIYGDSNNYWRQDANVQMYASGIRLNTALITGGASNGSLTFSPPAGTGDFIFSTDADSFVGIGTTTPSELLTVWGGMSVATSSSFQTFYVASTTGRVGVGTSSPATLFTVATSTNIFNVSLTGLSGFGTSSPSEILTVKASGAAAGLGVYASNSTPIIYTSLAGNVGIGTTGPLGLLHADKSANDGIGTRVISSNANSGSGAFSLVGAFNDAGTTVGNSVSLRALGTGYITAGAFVQDAGILIADDGLAGGLSIVSEASNSIIRFYTDGSTAGKEKVRIDSAGNVGIGTTTPASLLEIYSSAEANTQLTITAATSSTYDALLAFRTGASSPVTRFNLGADQSAGNNFVISTTTFGTADLFSINYASTSFSFATNTFAGLFNIATSSPILTVLPNGNVGIGTTGPSQKLSISEGGVLVDAGQYYYMGDVNWGIRRLDSELPTSNLGITGNAFVLREGGGANQGFMFFGGATLLAEMGGSDGAMWLKNNLYVGGNVGIGTTTATEVLTIKATSTSPGLGVYASNSTPIIYTTLAGGISVGTTTSLGLFYVATATPAFVITSAGRVGIGTSTPQALAHIWGNAATSTLTVQQTGSGNIVDFMSTSTSVFTLASEDRLRYRDGLTQTWGDLNGVVLDDFEDNNVANWVSTDSTNSSTTATTTYFKVGDYALGLTTVVNSSKGDTATTSPGTSDWSSYERLGFWLMAQYNSTSTLEASSTAGIINFRFKDDDGTTTDATSSIKEIGKWQYEEIDLANTTADDKNVVNWYGFRIENDYGSPIFYIDQIRLYDTDERTSEMFVDSSGGLNLVSPTRIDLTRGTPGSGSRPGLSVDSAVVEINQPLSVNVGGDVGMDYDLVFMNTGMSNITSEGPLTIRAGDADHYENLTLGTGGKGDIIMDISTSTMGLKIMGNATSSFGTYMFFMATSGEMQIGNTLTIAGNILPATSTSASSTYSLGDSGSRWAYLFVATSTVGDLVFANQFVITEASTLGINPPEALIFQNASGTNIMSIDESGQLTVDTIRARQLCVGEVCVTEEQFRTVFGTSTELSSIIPPSESTSTPSEEATSTPVVSVPETIIDLAFPANGEASTSTEASFEFHSEQNGTTTSDSTFQCKLGTVDWATCVSPRSYPGLTVGEYTFQVYAVDPSGNYDSSPASSTWSIIE